MLRVPEDILAYDPKKLQKSPFIIDVDSIPPVFKDKVRALSIHAISCSTPAYLCPSCVFLVTAC